ATGTVPALERCLPIPRQSSLGSTPDPALLFPVLLFGGRPPRPWPRPDSTPGLRFRRDAAGRRFSPPTRGGGGGAGGAAGGRGTGVGRGVRALSRARARNPPAHEISPRPPGPHRRGHPPPFGVPRCARFHL